MLDKSHLYWDAIEMPVQQCTPSKQSMCFT